MAIKTEKKTATKKTTSAVKKTPVKKETKVVKAPAKTASKKVATKKTAVKKEAPKKIKTNTKAQVMFDPTKSYKWDPNQQFVIDGKTFSELFMFLTFSRNLIPILEKSYQSSVAVIQRGIDEGFITEVEEAK